MGCHTAHIYVKCRGGVPSPPGSPRGKIKMNLAEIADLLLKLWPLLLLQLGLMVWALLDLLRRRSTRTLSVPLRAVLIIVIN